MSPPRFVLVHAGVLDSGMWDGFELPGEAIRHPLEAPLGDGVGGRPAALVGASYGGLVCLAFAARHPELVTALVVLDAPLPDHDWSDPGFIAYAEEEERLIDADDLEAATDLNLSYWRIDERHRPAVRRSLELDVDEVETVDLRTVRAPVLVVVGEDDNADFRAVAERLARELPDAELAVVPRAGHLPSMDRPDAVLELVNAFMERRSGL